MKVPCELVKDLLPLYLDGVCSEESKETVETHLAECPACSREAELLSRDFSAKNAEKTEAEAVRAASKAWKKGKNRARVLGAVLAIFAVLVSVTGYLGYHLFTTAKENEKSLTRKAEEYFGERLTFGKMTKKADLLAAEFFEENGDITLCVYERDPVFSNRWYPAGGFHGVKPGKLDSWITGDGDNISVYCGEDLPEAADTFRFYSTENTYCTVHIEDRSVLEIFIEPDTYFHSLSSLIPVLFDAEGNALALED